MQSHLLETLSAESQEIAALLSVEQVERVMQSVQDAYKSELQPGMANALPNSAPSDYVQANFPEHMMKMYTQTPERSAPSTPDSTPGSSISSWSWATPDRRKRPKKESEPAPEELFSAEQLLRETLRNVSGAQFTGIFVNHDVSVSREVDCMGFQEKRRSGNTVLTASTVMNFLCGDDTAVIQVTLWNEAVASFKRQLESMPADTPIMMEMKTFKGCKMRENEWNGRILSSMQQIESVRPWAKEKVTVVKLF